jgi:small-conductance mechanosensitive channel
MFGCRQRQRVRRPAWRTATPPLAHCLCRLILVLVLFTPVSVLGAGPWEGFWETYSFGDDAYLSLRQDGDRVTGAYFPYNGRIEGTDDNGVLRATWRSPNGAGTLVFTLSPDGQSFAGTIGSGEWWNGKRIDEDTIDFIDIDVSSPSHTIRSFMKAGYALRRGEVNGLQAMFSTLHFPGDVGFAEKSRRARLLYDVLSLTTFRVFEVRPSDDADVFTYRFGQAGTDEEVALTFNRDLFGVWRVVAPSEASLNETLDRLLEARGLSELNPSQYRQLASARHTIEAFIVGMANWHVEGRDLVRDTFNLSAIHEGLRGWQLPITAAFLANNLNRIGKITLQEFPDDPDSTKPFVYYTHPAGEIVIAPYPQPDGGVRWQFTPSTLNSTRDLFDALNKVPVVYDNVAIGLGDGPFFTLRRLANELSPRLTQKVAGIEAWQMLLLAAMTLLLPAVSHLFVSSFERRFSDGKAKELSAMRVRYGIPVRLLAIGGLWLLAAALLGLPVHLSGPIHATGTILVILGAAWVMYRLIDGMASLLHSHTRKTASAADDIAVSLVSGLLKIILIVVAAVAVADVLGMPYETVLAGVGIGGLAFAIASKDLIANLFGSAIIAADRPFRRGDFVSLGAIQGTVEKVGLRSTKLRPLDDTTVMIPNSQITTERVVNITRRRKIRLVETIHIDHDASVDALKQLRDNIREALLADDMVANENVRVGLDTLSLYAVDVQIACYIKTTNYDEFIYQKHRVLVNLLGIIEASGVHRAVIRRSEVPV